MRKPWFPITPLLPLALTFPAFSQSATYHYAYPDSCNAVWSAVKVVLSDAGHYNTKKTDDKKMNADYQPKHDVHLDVSGFIFQRENHARLSPKGSGCEMDVVSSYSGWNHDDQGDFKKRVDDALAKQKGLNPAVPADSAKPAPPPAQAAPTGQAR